VTSIVGDNRKRPKTGGRKPGVQNKTTAQVKEMILSALDKAGGTKYLHMQATLNPVAFMTLVGKVLPLQVNGPGPNGEHVFSRIVREVVDPK